MIVENGETVEPAADLVRLVDTYKRLVEPIANEVIGQLAPAAEPNQVITKNPDPNGGDSALGNLIADAQRADETIVTEDGRAPVIALMKPGGIRADLAENAAGDITYGNAFSVQPFNNFVVSMDLTGAQLHDVLNEQWNGGNEGAADRWKILQVSGLTYTWDASLAAETGSNAIVPGSLQLDANGDGVGESPIEDSDATTYRVAANNFISDGGDSFTTFKAATNKLVGGLDIDSLREYLLVHSPVSPTPSNRISQIP